MFGFNKAKKPKDALTEAERNNPGPKGNVRRQGHTTRMVDRAVQAFFEYEAIVFPLKDTDVSQYDRNQILIDPMWDFNGRLPGMQILLKNRFLDRMANEHPGVPVEVIGQYVRLKR